MRNELIERLKCVATTGDRRCNGRLAVDTGTVQPVSMRDGQEIRDALLRCAECGAHYPVIAGVPVVLENAASWLRLNFHYIVAGAHGCGGIGKDLTTWLEGIGWHLGNRATDNYYETPRWRNIFVATHYDSIQAGADDLSPLGRFIATQPSVFDVVPQMLKQHCTTPMSRALDIGCNVGGMAWRLDGLCKEVWGVDNAYNTILAARRIQRGMPEPIDDYHRHIDGNDYDVRAIAARTVNTEFLVGSAMHVPVSGRFDLVTALNVIDSVPTPGTMLKHLADLLETGGYLMVTSPYSWGSDDVPLENWIGGKMGLASDRALPECLRESGMEIVTEQDNVLWVLREHRRWYRVFQTHCVLARKRSA